MADTSDVFRSPQLRCLKALKAAKSAFFRDILFHARSHVKGKGEELDRERVSIIYSENVMHVAELFYLFKELEMYRHENMSEFIDLHNIDVENMKNEVKRDDAYRIIFGVEAQIIDMSKFSEGQKRKILSNLVGDRVRLDQTDIANFLSGIMSREACRITIVGLAECGLVDRSVGLQAFITSNGSLEQYFSTYLNAICGAYHVDP
ncbi:hypothetical protein [Azospirillum sp. TSH64]|uniref:hypothetical protein n=1 Tax=Azospirillum sp. TSH64 TaxID=652740 RepID=UPI0011B25E4A|nr:hypothetical protein [Azospirillum sp. TSH64]